MILPNVRTYLRLTHCIYGSSSGAEIIHICDFSVVAEVKATWKFIGTGSLKNSHRLCVASRAEFKTQNPPAYCMLSDECTTHPFSAYHKKFSKPGLLALQRFCILSPSGARR